MQLVILVLSNIWYLHNTPVTQQRRESVLHSKRQTQEKIDTDKTNKKKETDK